jgi:hypothetical protein
VLSVLNAHVRETIRAPPLPTLELSDGAANLPLLGYLPRKSWLCKGEPQSAPLLRRPPAGLQQIRAAICGQALGLGAPPVGDLFVVA